MRFVKRDIPRPKEIENDCGIIAASIALDEDYICALIEFHDELQKQGSISLATMNRYLSARGFQYHRIRPAVLAAARLPRGRLLVFSKIVREGELMGHFCAVIDGVLHDHSDTRDGIIHGFWKSKYERIPCGPALRSAARTNSASGSRVAKAAQGRPARRRFGGLRIGRRDGAA